MQPLDLRLIHAADLHLGYAFAGLPTKQGKILVHDEPRLLDRLVDLCFAENVDGLLLAGDVFEHDRPDPATVSMFRSAVKRLNDGGIYVFIAPGNHDPYWPDSPWVMESWPERTICFSPDRTYFDWKAKRSMIYGGAFTAKTEKTSLIDTLIPLPTERNINVLCLHGDIVSDGQISSYNPIRRRLLDTPHLDYIALGHIHKGRHTELDWAYDNAAYAGSWRGRGFDERGQKGVYLLSIRKDGSTLDLPFDHVLRHVNLTPGLTFVPLSSYIFLDVSLTRDGDEFSAKDILTRLQTIASDYATTPDRVLWRIRLTGDYGERRPSIDHLTTSLEKSLFYLEMTDISTSPQEESLFSEHSLKGAFLRESSHAITKDETFTLAVELGLEAFHGPIELDRYFSEHQP